MTWRDKFRPIIARVLASGGGDKELREEWHKMGGGHTKDSRYSYQYGVWRDEIARQRNPRAPRPKRKVRTMTAKQVKEWFEKKQMRMFEQ